MNKGLLRLYAIGCIGLILAFNIPEIRSLIEPKLNIIQPRVERLTQITYANITEAIAPIANTFIKSPQVVINGQVQDVDTTSNFLLTHKQSLTGEQIDSILRTMDSPAYGTGPKWVQAGIDHNVDAAYMLAIFVYESSAATNTGWVGWKDISHHTYNIGNEICNGYDGNNDKVIDCYKGFRDYSWSSDPWYAGIDDNTLNMRLYRDSGIHDFDTALLRWAPVSENNTAAYIATTHNLINGWRNLNKLAFTDAQAVSSPITEDSNDSFGYNVKVALDSNHKALRSFSIANGEQWSFNTMLGNPHAELKIVAGIEGGGWCDLACRYVQVFHNLGLKITHVTTPDNLPTDGELVFIQHGGIALNQCTYDESPFIWTNDFKGGFHNGNQDVIVNNDTGKTIMIAVVDNNDNTAIVTGKLK